MLFDYAVLLLVSNDQLQPLFVTTIIYLHVVRLSRHVLARSCLTKILLARKRTTLI